MDECHQRLSYLAELKAIPQAGMGISSVTSMNKHAVTASGMRPVDPAKDAALPVAQTARDAKPFKAATPDLMSCRDLEI